jgi:CRP-like cAMP-binding protein
MDAAGNAESRASSQRTRFLPLIGDFEDLLAGRATLTMMAIIRHQPDSAPHPMEAISPKNNGHSTSSYAPQQLIAEEGSPNGGWYVLLSGRVGVFKKGEKVAEFSARGEVFGEISSILHRPRSARLVALEPTSVIYFDTDLDQLIAHHPKVAKTMLISLAERLVQTTDALWSASEH